MRSFQHLFFKKMLPQKESPIIRAIKAVGIGKKGSKTLEPLLIEELISDFKNNLVTEAAKGAFFGALVMKGLSKGLTEDEKNLEKILKESNVCGDAPYPIQEICDRLLRGETLDKNTAKKLGDFLFSNQPGDAARGLAASILRVRYETPEEYAGLLLSLQETFEAPFRESVPEGEPIIQIAEPFDGVDQSNMITPLVGEYLQKLNYRVVHLVGRNSGPKMVYNLLDVAKQLDGCFLKRNQQLSDPKPPFGWFLNQQDLSKPMDRWVDIRRQIIKRPFLATLERFVNPLKADIIIASAFHPPYGEKMLNLCERAGFPAAIIVRNGMEGTIAFPLKRAVKILCSARKSDTTYARHEIEFNAENFLGKTVEIEERPLTQPSPEHNAELIQTYQRNGSTGNRHFDLRVKATCEGLKKAIECLCLDGSIYSS